MKKAKCPQCKKIIPHLQIEEIKVKKGEDIYDTGEILICPHCSSVLGAGLNTDKIACEILYNVKNTVSLVTDFGDEFSSLKESIRKPQSAGRVAGVQNPKPPNRKLD